MSGAPLNETSLYLPGPGPEPYRVCGLAFWAAAKNDSAGQCKAINAKLRMQGQLADSHPNNKGDMRSDKYNMGELVQSLSQSKRMSR